MFARSLPGHAQLVCGQLPCFNRDTAYLICPERSWEKEAGALGPLLWERLVANCTMLVAPCWAIIMVLYRGADCSAVCCGCNTTTQPPMTPVP